uniref:Uncharacterized protein n=1 Tax=Trypanosoma vivax (strain Y486) TaxID=1055687 RepID=G0U5E5_TRYVY|nr:hypothetical protein TVY486_1001470 [Trypanosoma vivax Y486]
MPHVFKVPSLYSSSQHLIPLIHIFIYLLIFLYMYVYIKASNFPSHISTLTNFLHFCPCRCVISLTTPFSIFTSKLPSFNNLLDSVHVALVPLHQSIFAFALRHSHI